MIFTAYFDESGTHADSEAVAVAGYLSTSELWASFKIEWRKVLADHAIDAFHMTDFAVGAKQFKGWAESKRRDCFGRLIKIINAHAIGSVGTVIPANLYKQIFSAKANNFVGGPYGLAATACFMSLAEILRLIGIQGWIAYVYDIGAHGRDQVYKVFTENEQDKVNKEFLRLLSLKFENDYQFVPLQAADILAYELYRHLPKQLGSDHRPPRLFSLRSLSAIPASWGYLDAKQLEMFAQVIDVRLQLEKKELWVSPVPSESMRPAIHNISVTDFQNRWRWANRFMGGSNAQMWTTK